MSRPMAKGAIVSGATSRDVSRGDDPPYPPTASGGRSVDRSTMTVAASLGVAGVTRPASRSASRAASFSPNQSSLIRTDRRPPLPDFGDQLYLDRGVEGEHRH